MKELFLVLIGGLCAAFGGFMAVLAEGYIAPEVAREVKREESILEQRYKVCESAVNILQQRLASVRLRGPNVPKDVKPTEKSPLPYEINITYTMLAVYCEDASIANDFKEVVKCHGLTQGEVGKFVSKVRSEIGLKGGMSPEDFRYIYGWETKEPKDE